MHFHQKLNEIESAYVTGILGLLGGTIGTYMVQHHLEEQKESLSKKRDRLERVYAPLEVLLKMNKVEYARYIKNETTTEDKEYIEKNVWYPNNSEIKRIIMEQSHLLPEIPDILIKLLIHINVWLTEYDLVYIKKIKPSPVFAGPKGYEYPKDVDEFILRESAKLRSMLNISNREKIAKIFKKNTNNLLL